MDYVKVLAGAAAGVGCIAVAPVFGAIGTVSAAGAVVGALSGSLVGAAVSDIDDEEKEKAYKDGRWKRRTTPTKSQSEEDEVAETEESISQDEDLDQSSKEEGSISQFDLENLILKSFGQEMSLDTDEEIAAKKGKLINSFAKVEEKIDHCYEYLKKTLPSSSDLEEKVAQIKEEIKAMMKKKAGATEDHQDALLKILQE